MRKKCSIILLLLMLVYCAGFADNKVEAFRCMDYVSQILDTVTSIESANYNWKGKWYVDEWQQIAHMAQEDNYTYSHVTDAIVDISASENDGTLVIDGYNIILPALKKSVIEIKSQQVDNIYGSKDVVFGKMALVDNKLYFHVRIVGAQDYAVEIYGVGRKEKNEICLCHAYEPLLTPGKSWTLVLNPHREDKSILCQKLGGDTLINDIQYTTLWEGNDQGSSIVGFLREDVKEQQVYLIPRYCDDQTENTEYLIYSFNHKVGDKVSAYFANLDQVIDLEILKIDSVQGHKRVQIFGFPKTEPSDDCAPDCGNSPMPVDAPWIEGVGAYGGIGLDRGRGSDPCHKMGLDFLMAQDGTKIIYKIDPSFISYNIDIEDCHCYDMPLAISSIQVQQPLPQSAHLVYSNGQILIERNGKTYTITGQQIK